MGGRVVNMNRHVTEHINATPAALAAYVARLLRQALMERGQASLAVSGGKSPIALFEALRQQPLDWSHIHIVLVDERVVPHHHADSNTALVRQHLLQEAASSAHLVPFFDDVPAHPSPQQLDALVRQARDRLSAVPWPLDVVVLGMGEDAHTASLFAGAQGYEQALRSTDTLAWLIPRTAPHARISLTLHSLLASRELLLPLAGPAKLAVYRQALRQADPALPISLLLNPVKQQTRTPVQVWLA